jgi:hypothetical protein
MRRARASAPPQYRDDPLLRFRGDRPVLGARKHPQLQLQERAARLQSFPSLISGRVFPRDPKESRSVLRPREESPSRAALTVDFLTSRRSGLLRHLETDYFASYDGSVGPAAKEGRDIENVFIDRIAHRRGAAVRIEALRSRMARIFRSPFGVAGRGAERWTV